RTRAMPPGDDTLFEPPDWLEREEQLLAPYAMRTRDSRGRRHPETPHPFRSLYTRDRDRIVHSTAFRRLMYKTQVLVTQTDDHHRTGLRIVQLLESSYADCPGLNLSWEVHEAQAHHSKRGDAPEVQEYRGQGQPLLEAQVVDAADSLAYDTHDVDDALSVGLV